MLQVSLVIRLAPDTQDTIMGQTSDIFMRIRRSAPLTNGSGSGSNSGSDSKTLRMQKKFIFPRIFSYNLPTGTLSSVLKIKFFAKILC